MAKSSANDLNRKSDYYDLEHSAMSKLNKYYEDSNIETDKIYAYGIDDSAREIRGENEAEEIVEGEKNVDAEKVERENLCKAFTLLDVDGDGVIELPELETLLVSLGRLPLDGDLAKILTYSKAEGCEKAIGMDFKGFRNYLVQQMKNSSDEDELREAFRVFDSNPPTGKLNVKELRHALKTMGKNLTDDEIDFLYREEDYWMLDERDMIDYEKLIDKLMGRPCKCKFLGC